MALVVNKTTFQCIYSANTPEYPTADWLHNPDVSGVAAQPDKAYWKVSGNAVVEQDATEKAATDLGRLDALKAARIEEIQERTGELRDEGFSYSGKQFGLSPRSVDMLEGVIIAKDSLSYPQTWNTLDELGSHDLADAAEVEVFFMTALGTYKAIQDAGSALKASIRAATTKAELDAVVDNR